MDSVLEEDVTLSETLSGCSGLVSTLADNLNSISISASLGNGGLSQTSEEKVSPTRVRNMKDFENQITELKKENFNLKLRIYFLEERMQQEFDGSTEQVYKTNIELKVEVESLKRELHEREKLLIKASKAVESLAEGGGSEIQRVKEDAQKKVQQVEDLLTRRIRLLEGDVKAAQAELEKAFVGTETEKALRLDLESQLAAMQKMQEEDVEVALALDEKDRLIEELKLSLKSKEALIQCLKEEKSQMASPDENVASGELQGLSTAPREAKETDVEAIQMELQKERNHFEERIQALQEDLREKEREIATEKKNSLKRDKAIQGLTMALKSKEREVEELNAEIKELSAAFAEVREDSPKTQTQKFQESEDDQAALAEKEALLAELHSENITKSTENHRLRKNMKKMIQELAELQQEKARLEYELDEARREGSRGARTANDLRNEVEKLRNEMKEREKAVENHYQDLLSESNRKLHSQEEVIKHLRESANEKDFILQKFREKDLEAIQQSHHLMSAENLEFGSEGLITEKCSSQQSPGSKLIFPQEKLYADYEELVKVLKKEQDLYAHLVKTLQDPNSVNNLQTELNHIFGLRKQLEQDVLAHRNLQKALEEQISEIRRREEDPFSFYSDQTSYLSICLEEPDQFQVEHFSQEELKRKVSDLIQLVKELYTENQHLKKTIFDISCMGVQGNGRLESTQQIELLASKEDEDTIKMEEEGEINSQSDQPLQQSNEVKEDHVKGGCKNGYLRHMDANILDYDGVLKHSHLGDQCLEELLALLTPFFHEKASSLLESRPDLMKALQELLLGQICLAEQEFSGEHVDGKTEKILKQIAVQLRGELGHSVPASTFTKSPDGLKSPGRGQLVKTGEVDRLELKDASVQTLAVEEDPSSFTSEGQKKAWEEMTADAISSESQPGNLCELPGLQTTFLSFPCVANKEAKKSRLPIPMKPARSLGHTYHFPATQELVAQLQGQIMELQGELQECKTHNKQLYHKLILVEGLMEGRPASDQILLKVPAAQPLVEAAYQDSSGKQEESQSISSAQRDKEVDNDQHTNLETDSEAYSPEDLALLPTYKENTEDFLDPTCTTTCLDSKSQLSVKVCVIESDQSEDPDVSHDVEYLKKKICDLETELEGYRNFLFQLQKHSQCSEAIITVLCGTEGAQDGLNKAKGSTEEEEMAFSSLHQVRYVKHMKILRPLAPEMIDSRMLESLKQQLVKQEYELQQEQNLNLELFSEIHNLQNKFQDFSPCRYDSLVQSQARELSLQRQQIKDSYDICVIYRQHMSTMINAFEELLQASDVDDCVAVGFQEQLNQCAELLQSLEKLFLHGKSVRMEPGSQNELIERTKEDIPIYHHILPKSPEPPTSHVSSDDEISEKSFLSRDQKQDSETEKTSAASSHFPQDLLMEHIQEIRTLRKRLEESIKTNEKLRKQLERQGSELEQGPTNTLLHGSELHNSLTSEIHFLRQQNQALSLMLVKGSKDKQKENDELRESLSKKATSFEHLQRECAGVKEENERLWKDIAERESHSQQLTQELNRAHEEVMSKQQLLCQNDKLLQSLRVELKVYEKLDEEHRQRQQEAQAEVSGEGCKRQDPLKDLHGLLTEMQALRAQLEKSIETNSALRSRLEEQLEQGAQKAQGGALIPATEARCIPEWSLQLDKHDDDKRLVPSENSFDSTQAATIQSASETFPLSGNDMDSLSCDGSTLTTNSAQVTFLVTSHRLWASNSGRHILGLVEDYDALCKQISQGHRLLAEVDLQTQEALSSTRGELKIKGPHLVLLSKFVSSVSAVKLILEEASRLLRLLWRVSLPPNGPCSLHCEQIDEMKSEITNLHKKLFEQEKKLQNSVKLLQQSKHQEKVIFDQLAVTHKVLRKARGNLELRPGGAYPGMSSPSRSGS